MSNVILVEAKECVVKSFAHCVFYLLLRLSHVFSLPFDFSLRMLGKYAIMFIFQKHLSPAEI